LSPLEREHALALSRALAGAEGAARNGASAARVVRTGTDVLNTATGLSVDYFAALDPRTAQAVPADHRGEAVIAVAATVGTTRLIDNTTVLIDSEGRLP
ncbi:MAG: pantoate--beta-alanine ligase, partial [Dietzia cercidiphylli]